MQRAGHARAAHAARSRQEARARRPPRTVTRLTRVPEALRHQGSRRPWFVPAPPSHPGPRRLAQSCCQVWALTLGPKGPLTFGSLCLSSPHPSAGTVPFQGLPGTPRPCGGRCSRGLGKRLVSRRRNLQATALGGQEPPADGKSSLAAALGPRKAPLPQPFLPRTSFSSSSALSGF